MDKKGIGTAGKIGMVVVIILLAFIGFMVMDGPEDYNPGETRYGEVVFTEDLPEDYDVYEENPDATYDIDEDIWIYADIDDVGLILGEEEDTGNEGVWIQVDSWLTVEDEEGNEVVERTQVLEFDDGWLVDHDDEETMDELIETFYTHYTIEDYMIEETGEYELILELEDKSSDETDEWTGTFTIEEDPDSDVMGPEDISSIEIEYESEGDDVVYTLTNIDDEQNLKGRMVTEHHEWGEFIEVLNGELESAWYYYENFPDLDLEEVWFKLPDEDYEDSMSGTREEFLVTLMDGIPPDWTGGDFTVNGTEIRVIDVNHDPDEDLFEIEEYEEFPE